MGPKKGVKMHLTEFQADSAFGSTGSWADDDTQDVFRSSSTGYGSSQSGPADDAGFWRGGSGASGATRREPSGGFERSIDLPSREPVGIPDSPPYTARLINLDYNATEADIEQLFPTDAFKVVSIKLPKDLNTGRVKGFAFVDFEDRKSLEDALALDGTSVLNRSVKVLVAERRERRDGEDERFDNDWRNSRRGPLPPLDHEDGPRRGGFRSSSGGLPDDNRNYDNWERRGPLPPREDRFGGSGEEGGRRKFSGRREDPDDGRNYDNWERRGPLPPLEEPRFGGSGEEGGRRKFSNRSREDPDDTRNYDNWEHRGPLPPRQDSSSGFRGGRRSSGQTPRATPTTPEEEDDDWRAHKHVPVPAGGRKRLNLAPRTVMTRDRTASAEGRSKGVFGSAAPVDTSKKESEIESRLQKDREESKAKGESKKETKTDKLSKSFAVLSTEDTEDAEGDDEANEENKDQSGSKTEELTAAERALSQEASKEDLESNEWETVKKGSKR